MTESATTKSYKSLKVWQKAVSLAEFVYGATQSFPKEEIYSLTSQVRRAAISIPSNIAEGSARRSTQEFIRFINIAYGSLSELETQFYLARRLNFITDEVLASLDSQTSELGEMLTGLRQGLNKRLNSNQILIPKT
jgi:four helix bundle protein